MKYLQPRFSVSMPGGACDWPFVPRGAWYTFWFEVSAFLVFEAFGHAASELVDEACRSR